MKLVLNLKFLLVGSLISFPLKINLASETYVWPKLNFNDLIKKKILIYGGERGIRTLDSIATIHAFQACAFNHSATSPAYISYDLSH